MGGLGLRRAQGRLLFCLFILLFIAFIHFVLGKTGGEVYAASGDRL